MPQIQLDDLALNYIAAGDGEPLVMLHGLGGSVEDWEYQIPYFAARYRVLAPDLRGFGATPRGRRRISIPQLARDVRAFVDAMGVGRFRLMGHSMGGAVAQEFTLAQPQRVERLVIANSVPTFQPESPRHYVEFFYRLVVMGLLGPKWLSEIGAARSYPDPADAAKRERAIRRGARNSRRSYLGALMALGGWSIMSRLDELTMPVLVAASEHDYFGHDKTVLFAHALPRARLHVFKDAHHGLPSEYPDEFNQVVARFLEGRVPALRKATQP
ncbi:MAG TPA: alpha/beta hydrolase [Fontimonas sp.]